MEIFRKKVLQKGGGSLDLGVQKPVLNQYWRYMDLSLVDYFQITDLTLDKNCIMSCVLGGAKFTTTGDIMSDPRENN